MDSLKFDIVRIGSVTLKYRSPVLKRYTELFTYTVLKVVSREFSICRYVLKDESFADADSNWQTYSYIDYKVFDSLDYLKAYIKDFSIHGPYIIKYHGDFK